jgi:hypothetical protein
LVSMMKVIQGALQQYREEVAALAFPTMRFSPYRIARAEGEAFVRELEAAGLAAAAAGAREHLEAVADGI